MDATFDHLTTTERKGSGMRALLIAVAAVFAPLVASTSVRAQNRAPVLEMPSPATCEPAPFPGNSARTQGYAPTTFLEIPASPASFSGNQVLPARFVAEQDETLKKQLELLQKQVETQQKMILLLGDQLKKQPPTGASLEALQAQIATLEARSKQAAQRDVELAGAVDDLAEQRDADRRNPFLPAGLKELFLPSGTNETPLSIYGTLAFGYSKILGDAKTAANGAGRPPTPGGFYFGEFTPDFLLKLNDWILLEAEIGIGSDGSVSAGSFAQMDFFVNDWLTINAGRFVTPIGFYNLRLNNPWINKLPSDAPGSGPLVWQQVLPPLAMLGVQASGAFYLGSSPIKMEYNAYVGNGMNFAPAKAGAPTLDELANLQNMESTFSTVSNNVTVGGRLGLWYPEKGWAGGFSYLHNPHYMAGSDNAINIYAIDLNYHMGNWDARAEYGLTNQQAKPFLAENITRQGFWAQLAYRPRDAVNKHVQNVEFVYRYTYASFGGINANGLDLSTYGTPIDVPVRRQQNEIGVNYYFYPRAMMKIAYQINDELGFHLHDNQILAELAWGF